MHLWGVLHYPLHPLLDDMFPRLQPLCIIPPELAPGTVETCQLWNHWTYSFQHDIASWSASFFLVILQCHTPFQISNGQFHVHKAGGSRLFKTTPGIWVKPGQYPLSLDGRTKACVRFKENPGTCICHVYHLLTDWLYYALWELVSPLAFI